MLLTFNEATYASISCQVFIHFGPFSLHTNSIIQALLILVFYKWNIYRKMILLWDRKLISNKAGVWTKTVFIY